ncbi:tetratricopeptide repeat protein [Thermodesulfobacteriota bacterium]
MVFKVKNHICQKTYPAILLILLVGIIVYSNTFQVPFVLDDHSSIINNPAVKSLDNFYQNIGNYKFLMNRFVVFRTFAYNYHFGGLDVTGYHVINLLIHLMSSLLVYSLLRLTFRTPYFQVTGQNFDPKPSTLSPQPSVLSPQSSVLSPQSSVLSPQSSVLCQSSAASYADNPQSFIPLFGALLFVVHPVQTQAVTYIVQRLTSMATMFYLLSVVLYVKARLSIDGIRDCRRLTEQSAVKSKELGVKSNESGEKNQNSREKKISSLIPPHFLLIFYYAGSVIAAVLAMKSKEIAFTLPFAVILYEVYFFRGSWKRRFFYLLPLLFTLPIIPMTVIGISETSGDIISGADEQLRVQSSMSRLDYLLTQFRVIITYLRLLFLPINQNLDYDYAVYTTFFTTPVFLPFLLLMGTFTLAVYLFFLTRTKPQSQSKQVFHKSCLRLISFGIFWFFLALSVESSLVPIKDVIMEHRLYLPFFGASVAFAMTYYLLVRKLTRPPSGKLLFLSASLLVIVLGAATFQRNHVWGDSVRLWQDIVSKSPNKGRPLNNLGKALEEHGRRSEAVEAFSKSIAVDPGYYKAYYNLADLYLVSDEPKTALQLLQTAIRLNPSFTEAYVSIGATFMRAGKFREVIIFLEQNLDRIADNAEARFYLGSSYAFLGKREAAIRELAILSKLDASYAANLAGMLGLKPNSKTPHGSQ